MDWLAWLIGSALVASLLMLVRYQPTLPDHVMASEMRCRIVALLRERPMSSKKALRERLDCSAGTLDHHLWILQQYNVLGSFRVGQYRRYFLVDAGISSVRAIGVLRGRQELTLARKVLERPGLVQQDLTTELQMSRKMVRTYMDRLLAAGLVQERAVGRFYAYYPGKPLATALDALTGEVGEGGRRGRRVR